VLDYWYKSTNTDTRKIAGLLALVLQKYLL
jgi:hypothetical protein